MIKNREQFGELLNSKNLTGYGVELGVASGHFSQIILKISLAENAIQTTPLIR